MVQNEITSFTPRILLSTPRVTPTGANKSSGNKEVVFVNMFVSVYIHSQQNRRGRSTTPVTPPNEEQSSIHVRSRWIPTSY